MSDQTRTPFQVNVRDIGGALSNNALGQRRTLHPIRVARAARLRGWVARRCSGCPSVRRAMSLSGARRLPAAWSDWRFVRRQRGLEASREAAAGRGWSRFATATTHLAPNVWLTIVSFLVRCHVPAWLELGPKDMRAVAVAPGALGRGHLRRLRPGFVATTSRTASTSSCGRPAGLRRRRAPGCRI
jgi:hypothetical protein